VNTSNAIVCRRRRRMVVTTYDTTPWFSSSLMATRPDIPALVGPAEFSTVGAMPGSRHWLIEERRIRSLVRNLQHNTDPLFWRGGLTKPGCIDRG
jgi:hypothetical protein